MQPKTTIWDLEPHTAAKHDILRRYLQAWVPILSQGKFPQLVFIDGFAGPGRYSQGEEGSPVIAVKAALEQRLPISAKLDFHFIELDKRRSEHLATELAAITLPSNFTTKIHGQRTFQDAFPEVWQRYTPKTGKRPPTFVFIDPFGIKIPFSYVSEILRAPNCEVLITFMFEEIGRFLSHENFEERLDELYGCREWRDCLDKSLPPKVKEKRLHDLYQRQLSGVATHVRSFTMRNNNNRTDYFLFFATNSEAGLRKMKASMWKVDEHGTFSFSDSTDPTQTMLFSAEPDSARLRTLIIDKFGGREATVGEVEHFVVCDPISPFRESHYKSVLAKLEAEGKLAAIDPPASRRRGKYPDLNLRLRFSPKETGLFY